MARWWALRTTAPFHAFVSNEKPRTLSRPPRCGDAGRFRQSTLDCLFSSAEQEPDNRADDNLTPLASTLPRKSSLRRRGEIKIRLVPAAQHPFIYFDCLAALGC